MNREAQSIVTTLMGGLLIAITVSGQYLSYVKPSFGPLLLAAGVVLALAGIASLYLAARGETRGARRAAERAEAAAGSGTGSETGPGTGPAEPAGHDAHGHSHDRSKAPWLILAPVVVLLTMAPPALGADAVTRNAGSQALAGELPDSGAAQQDSAPATGGAAGDKSGAGGGSEGYAFNDGSGHGVGTKNLGKTRQTMPFPDLPAGQNPHIGLKDFVLRAIYDGADSVSKNQVTVTGFIAPAGDGYSGGYSIARLVISCCAADANPMRIHVDGDPQFPVNTWVTAVVKAVPMTADEDNDYVPAVELVSVTQTTQPEDPYEH